MQIYGPMPPFREVALVAKRVFQCYGGGRTGACLLFCFVLFRTKHVRYMVAFWCMISQGF